jgi:hypothetical protein
VGSLFSVSQTVAPLESVTFTVTPASADSAPSRTPLLAAPPPLPLSLNTVPASVLP